MSDNSEKSLSNFRADLDLIDQKLIELFGQRINLVGQISEIKRQQGKALFDRSREKEIVERSTNVALQLGIKPAYVRRLMELLFDVSYQEQENRGPSSLSHTKLTPAAHTSSVLIIGGHGKMGQLFGGALSDRGHTVSVIDRDQALDSKVIESADVVIVSVPMEISAKVVAAVAPKVRKDALLCDFNSLKAEVCQVMRQAGDSEAVGMHPMFGPSVKSFRRQKIVLCPIRSGQRLAWWREELGAFGFELLDSDPETHDQMMAVIQVMTHLGTMVMGEALRSSGVNVEKTLEFTSPIYRLELAMIGRLFAQDPNLYGEIALSNPLSPKARKTFLEAAKRLVGILDTGDREAFRQQFLSIKDHFRTFSSEAMKLSDRIIETITREP